MGAPHVSTRSQGTAQPQQGNSASKKLPSSSTAFLHSQNEVQEPDGRPVGAAQTLVAGGFGLLCGWCAGIRGHCKNDNIRRDGHKPGHQP